MLDKFALWSALEPIVKGEGFELYDIELPPSKNGVLRVFISVPCGNVADALDRRRLPAVTVDDCACVSKRISAMLEAEGSYLAEMTLEVSSPGVNRKLTRPEHFKNAIGERVRLKTNPAVRKDTGLGPVLMGRVMAFDGGNLQLEEESSKKIVSLSYGDIREARVDFLF